MKILHLVSGPLNGGAARGAYWLHKGQLDMGIDSTLMTNYLDTRNLPNVISCSTNKLSFAKNLLIKECNNIPLFLYSGRNNRIFSTGLFGIDITNCDQYREASIIHLHWINGFIASSILKKIKKPIVWTIRDMWPVTGGCHYSLDCKRYLENCGQCPQLNSNSQCDLSRLVLSNKKKIYPSNLYPIGISEWMSEVINQSGVFSSHKAETILNNINCNEFYPVEKKIARKLLNINTSKTILLIGSTNLNDFYKGFNYLSDALRFLDKNKYFLCFFGTDNNSSLSSLGYEYKSLGYLSDNLSLSIAYSASDLFIAPSIQEAFGKTIVESMSCGTPVVCFDATGPKSIVTHKFDGYRATPFSPEDLANGISWVLSNKTNYTQMCLNARESAISKFDSKIIALQYNELYKKILTE